MGIFTKLKRGKTVNDYTLDDALDMAQQLQDNATDSYDTTEEDDR